jgi:hypothetical protein
MLEKIIDRPITVAVISLSIGVIARAVYSLYARGKPAKIRSSLRGKRICVTGPISDYQGKPEIVPSEPGQLTQ